MLNISPPTPLLYLLTVRITKSFILPRFHRPWWKNLTHTNSVELMENLNDIFVSYYDNHLISAEECAKQLQERAWIYLSE